MQYTHCGCPLPGESIGQRLSRLVGNRKNPSYLIPPNRDDLLAATHPSDHNAVFAFHHKAASEAAQRRRRLKIAKREKRDAERAQAGKLGGRRNVPHDPAFLVPVPLYYMPVVPGCAAFTGNVVNGGTGFGACAVGAGACGVGGAACSSGGGCGGDGGGCGTTIFTTLFLVLSTLACIFSSCSLVSNDTHTHYFHRWWLRWWLRWRMRGWMRRVVSRQRTLALGSSAQAHHAHLLFGTLSMFVYHVTHWGIFDYSMYFYVL
ncbi:hypothetical protein K438DRAFT_1830786 [Mycena galopus ATCC 62051]|nr:hypothetical protein K438DRAFT_1830786 [Mycena galopus ATCC 62051]